MSIPSNTRRPHVMGAITRIARDSDEGTVNFDALIRELIERVPEAERGRYAELLLGDKNALEGRTFTAQDAAEARFQRAHALAVAGRLDEFAAVAARLPDHNRIEPPARTVAPRRPWTAQDSYEAALTSGARAEASAAADALFPNMNRLAGVR